MIETGAAGVTRVRPLRGSALRPLAGFESRRHGIRSAVSPEPILVLGSPRSGSTWLASVLGKAREALLVNEPDNTDVDAWAAAAVGAPYAFAVIRPGERAPLYELLWECSFRGGNTALAEFAPRPLANLNSRLARWRRPRTTMRAVGIASLIWRSRLALLRRVSESTTKVVVKSVLANLAAEWIADRFSPRVVVIHRHPLDVIASNRELGFNPRPHPHDARLRELVLRDPNIPSPAGTGSTIGRLAWGLGVQLAYLGRALRTHPDWLAVSHEELVADPLQSFGRLFDNLGLEWSPEIGSLIERSNAPGHGHQLTRVWADLKDGWKQKLSPDEADEALAVLSSFHRPDVGWSLGLVD